MRGMAILGLTAMGSAVFWGNALAADQSVIMASDPGSIVDIARGYGSAALSADDNGDPLIKGRIDGLAYSIYFYDCENHVKCKSVQLYAGFEVSPKPDFKRLNEWNQTKRWSKAYANKAGDPGIEYDVSMLHGIPRDTLDEVFSLWGGLIKDFGTFIGYKP